MKRLFFISIFVFACFLGYCQESYFVVELKLKPQADKSYLATEDAEIKALLSKHDVTLKQTFAGLKTPESLLLYALRGISSKENKEKAIKELLATGKFEEDFVRDSKLAYACSCPNPVIPNDFYKQMWPLNMIQAPCAWSVTTGSASILIGIADTEFDTTHEDLMYKIEGIDGPVSPIPYHHGTMVASIAAAHTNNNTGMASIGYNSKIMAQRFSHFIDPSTGPYFLHIADGVNEKPEVRVIIVKH